jgi:hypothetical protein
MYSVSQLFYKLDERFPRVMVAPAALDAAIAKLNARLKAARLGLQVERRGDRLSLRGTLPPRPGSGKSRPHQQRIPLKLPATPAGLKPITSH